MDIRPRTARNLLAATALFVIAAAPAPPEAARVTITRDTWGIAHVVGKSDADAVFGAIYAQAEDDFNRIEANYLTALGRTAEAEGEAAIWADLRQRLYVDPVDLKAKYRQSAPWLQKLMTAWADGLNYYLATHPNVRPKVLTHFEPWMALSFTEGSIGGDIERISLNDLAAFYGKTSIAVAAEDAGPVPREPRGSNGIAIAPKNTVNGHALLLINPHTSFYFRSELQMTSGEGLNAYGASTWGQFFIYQGFNEKAGWMHTSSGVDNVDEFAEDVVRGAAGVSYRYGKAIRRMRSARVTLAYRKPDGTLGSRSFSTYASHHGPIIAERGGKWIAQGLMWKPIPALEQSWLRTKATDLASYMKVAERKANSSNDTLFADAKGEIAYLHPQFVPVRDTRFDYAKPVDGADPATDWKGLHSVASLPNAINPGVGYAFNTNNWPWTAAGPDSPKAKDYPRYMDTFGENPRGVHADLLLRNAHDFTPERLIAAAYDSYLPAFAELIPPLVKAYDALPTGDPRRAKLAGPIAELRGWDYRWGADSVATTLGVLWGGKMWREVGSFIQAEQINVPKYIATRVSDSRKLDALGEAIEQLTRDFGDWKIGWGQINRFQRLDDSIDAHFDDAKPSIPVPFTSAQWGSLASFGARPYANTKKLYGSSGNSFVAVVEFGPKLRAWAVTAGGESGDPASLHFTDQAERYAAGALRPVYFYPADLAAHVERRYRPGEPRFATRSG
ncbi:penicillin acylase family protein [Sphingomonas sp. HMP6]|uniref:penicillin acylase family protein n=1 Tax=Sphingomonas sp. HMP6 TaxID=1517551 RepID=UPI00159673E8|nr:penicillin acylase family protein [Sphingomonas sp. HMP6]BCA59263.1 penicillin amidase [Sphingomonas sp. HMP6]